jgi:hypothetical protein
MQWWNDFVTWLSATRNQPVIFSAIVLIVAIIVASLLAAWIAKSAIKRLLDQHDRELRASAIGTIVDAATEASVWNSLTPQEQVMNDRAVGMADIQVRLLPIKGASIAADWAAHQLAELKRTSATFGYQLEPALVEFRDRLIEWQNKPSRARKIFQADIDRWKAQSSPTEKNLVAEQDAWVAQQHHDQFAAGPKTTAGQPLGYVPAAPAPAPSTETQRLLDDVQALEVRPAPLPNP